MSNSNIKSDYTISNYKNFVSQRDRLQITPATSGSDAIPEVPAEEAEGSFTIASGGGSFDTASNPEITINDGTNSLTFVIDDDAKGMTSTSFSSSPTTRYIDNFAGKLHVPTKDGSGTAKKSILTFFPREITRLIGYFTDATIDYESVVSNGNSLTDISSRPHFKISDSEGNSINISLGPSGSFLTNGGAEVVTNGGFYSNSKGISRRECEVYRESSVSDSFYISMAQTGANGGTDFKEEQEEITHAFTQAINFASGSSLINIRATAVCVEFSNSSSTVSEIVPSTVVSNATGHDGIEVGGSNLPIMIKLESDSSGPVANSCFIELKDPNNNWIAQEDINDDPAECFYWGYTSWENLSAFVLRFDPYTRYDDTHGEAPGTGDEGHLFINNKNTKIFFKQGTIAGSGPSQSSLTQAEIAEAIKDIINASVLNIAATRDNTVVNLEADSGGTSFNNDITTSNIGSLITDISGMSGGTNGTPEVPAVDPTPEIRTAIPLNYESGDIVQYRLSVKGAQNIRGQSTNQAYKLFLGEEKT